VHGDVKDLVGSNVGEFLHRARGPTDAAPHKTNGNISSAAWGSPSSIELRMRVTSLMERRISGSRGMATVS
jgi:hypothetical protein